MEVRGWLSSTFNLPYSKIIRQQEVYESRGKMALVLQSARCSPTSAQESATLLKDYACEFGKMLGVGPGNTAVRRAGLKPD